MVIYIYAMLIDKNGEKLGIERGQNMDATIDKLMKRILLILITFIILWLLPSGVALAFTDITISKASIAENSPSGTMIGTLLGIDPEDATSLSYSLISGVGDSDNGYFTIIGDELMLGFVPDFETRDSYSIRVSVSDGLLSYEKQFNITINNVNEAPTDISLSKYTIAENSAIGAEICKLSGTDPDAGTTLTYSLSETGVDYTKVTISGTSLKLAVVPNYEHKSNYIIEVRVSDGYLAYYEAFNIGILDVNDAPTDIILSSTSVLEHCAIGTAVGILSSTDEDGGDFAYSLVAGDGPNDNGSFSISDNTLQVAIPPDFETKKSHSIRIRTTDSNGLIYEKVLTISITDGVDPPTDISITTNKIAENSAIGTTIGTLSSIDLSGPFAYTLVSGAGDTDNASFTIISDSLKLAFVPNYEEDNSYSIRIRTENISTGYSYDKAFTISITDVNEAPSDVNLSETSVIENTASGTTVGTLSGTDPDKDSKFTYSLVTGTVDTDNACFTVSGNELKLAVEPDYEAKTDYKIRVSVSDGFLTYTKQFTITITKNDAPTDIGLSSININEDTTTGTSIATISSTDPNGGIFTYSLVTGEGSTDNASFAISLDELKLAIEPDFEVKQSYNLRICTVDHGGLSFEKALVISINDINEAPSNIIISKANITENSAVGTTVGTFTGMDEDATDSLTYTLVSGIGSGDNSSFILSGNELKIAIIPDYEARQSYSIRVRATDKGDLYYEKSFTITINDVNDNPPSISIPTPETPEEKLTLDVTNGTTDDSVTQLEVVRTTTPEGIINDSVTFDEGKAGETIKRLADEDAEVARIVVPKSEEEVSEVKVIIPSKSVDKLSDTDLSLEIETEYVIISIPNTSLDTASEEMERDLYFKISQVTDKEEKQDVSDNANKEGMLIQMLGKDFAIIGSTIEIQTNMPQATVDIILPLTGITIPKDEKERKILFSKFAIYVEHSDGEKEVIKGVVIEIKPGVYGLKFSATKFSSFTIFKDERSNKCKATSVKLPADTKINGSLFVSKVSFKTTSVNVAIRVSSGATWKLYSNKACTKGIKNKVNLKVGLNKSYIKVIAEDRVSYKVYTVYITRGKQR